MTDRKIIAVVGATGAQGGGGSGHQYGQHERRIRAQAGRAVRIEAVQARHQRLVGRRRASVTFIAARNRCGDHFVDGERRAAHDGRDAA